jgi:hypothetical protein
MIMDNKHTLIGLDGVVEFGEYLNKLHQVTHRAYTFEMPDASGRLVACSLEDVIRELHDYIESRRQVFRVQIICVDRQAGTISSTDKQFKRVSK